MLRRLFAFLPAYSAYAAAVVVVVVVVVTVVDRSGGFEFAKLVSDLGRGFSKTRRGGAFLRRRLLSPFVVFALYSSYSSSSLLIYSIHRHQIWVFWKRVLEGVSFPF